MSACINRHIYSRIGGLDVDICVDLWIFICIDSTMRVFSHSPHYLYTSLTITPATTPTTITVTTTPTPTPTPC